MVAISTYFFHRLIVRKVKKTILSQRRYLFLRNCLLSSPLRFIWLLSKSLNLIGCQGDKKGKFRKNVKGLLLRNHKVVEADTVLTCLFH